MEENRSLTTLGKTLQLKTLKDLVRVKTAEKTLLLLDCSGSMAAAMRNGKRRIDGLREVVNDVQTKRPTEMVAFGPYIAPEPGSDLLGGQYNVVGFVTTPPEPGGGTPLQTALDFAAKHGAGRVVVVSDGWPDDRTGSLDAAKRFGGRVDVVFVGDPEDPGSFFLDELAKATGGTRFEGDLSEIKELTGVVVGLLNGEVMEEVPEGIELGAGDEEEDDDTDDEDDDEEDDEEDDDE